MRTTVAAPVSPAKITNVICAVRLRVLVEFADRPQSLHDLWTRYPVRRQGCAKHSNQASHRKRYRERSQRNLQQDGEWGAGVRVNESEDETVCPKSPQKNRSCPRFVRIL